MADVEMRPASTDTMTGPKKLALLTGAGGVIGFVLGWVLNVFTGADNPLALGALGMVVGGMGGALCCRLMDRELKA